jgi:5-oxoprolinase (ATP-hydrolysing)
MSEAVRFQVAYYSPGGPGEQEGLEEGDVLLSNHPQLAGGSHLPDITVITPVFSGGRIVFFVASRGHHADIGGISPGSMPPASKLLAEEGAAIVSFKLVKDGVFQVRKCSSSTSFKGVSLGHQTFSLIPHTCIPPISRNLASQSC